MALAESGCQYNVYLCNPSLAQGYYPPVSCPAGTGSDDRGLWQINSHYHSEVSDACAFQVQCNTAAAFLISDKGRNWSAWAPYNSGAWAGYISLAEQSVYGFSFQLQNHGDGTCLDADSRQPYDKGKIFQWTCSHSDKYQQWKLIGTTGNLPILQNVGTGTCLDADSRQPYDKGKIFQWRCRTTDPYQQWRFHGSGQLNVNGNANAVLHSQGTRTTCLDGDSRAAGNRAPHLPAAVQPERYFPAVELGHRHDAGRHAAIGGDSWPTQCGRAAGTIRGRRVNRARSAWLGDAVCRLSACEPVAEPVHMQCLPDGAGQSRSRRGIGRAVLAQQVAEIERAGCCGCFSFQCPEPFALARPAAVQVPALPEDVRAELASGKMGDEMSPVHQRATGIAVLSPW